MSGRETAADLLTVVLVLLVVALVLYLEWWSRGELELLNRRVDELEQKPAPVVPAPARKKPKTEAKP